MARGRLEPPNLDDRTWQDLVDQAKALVPQYAPQWTDLGPSDPGLALIELFAWLVEGMIYRLNRVPDKNYVAFLNLLGITRSPATPATTWLTYTCNSQDSVELDLGTQAATQQTESRPAIVFETDEKLTVLPAKLVKLYVGGIEKTNDPLDLHDMTADLVGPEPQGRGAAGRELTLKNKKVIFWLGFDVDPRAKGDYSYSIHVEIAEPRWAGEGKLTFSYSRTGKSWGTFEQDQKPRIVDGTGGLRRTGRISFDEPRDWASVSIKDLTKSDFTKIDPEAEKLRHWLRWEFSATPEGDSEPVLHIKHVLFNSVTATAVQRVTREVLGLGTGKPYQTLELANRPLYKDPRNSGQPYHHLELTVADKPWTLVEDMGTDPDAPVYRVDPVTGTIYFGRGRGGTSGDPRDLDLGGMAPSAGSQIVAAYRYVPAGAAGNVPAGAINTQRVPKSEISWVINPVQAYGGTDEEEIEETKRRAPRELRNFNRAVTLEDYEDLAHKADNRVKKVRCLGPRYVFGDPKTAESYANMIRQEGNVHVIILPVVSSSDDPKQQVDPHPRPPIDLIHEVQRYLDERRPLTTRLFVTGPRYLEITITIKVKLWPEALRVGGGEAREQFRKTLAGKLDRAIVRYLHPIEGKSDGKGWKVGEHFFVSGLFQHLQQTVIGDLGYIESLTAGKKAGYFPADRPESSLPSLGDGVAGIGVADYEIVCSNNTAVKDGLRHDVTVEEVKK